jgi:translation initiation factor IF-3
VIGEDGEQLGVFMTKEAIRIAQERNLDLIEIVPTATPPVCKIMDFGKYRYEMSKREKLQKKHQVTSQVKEVRFHPRTDTHDFEFKTRHARAFIEEGHKVKATVVFRGRQITYQDQGREMLARFTERMADIAKLEQDPRMEGRQMVAVFVADKTKKKVTTSKSKESEKEQDHA